MLGRLAVVPQFDVKLGRDFSSANSAKTENGATMKAKMTLFKTLVPRYQRAKLILPRLT